MKGQQGPEGRTQETLTPRARPGERGAGEGALTQELPLSSLLLWGWG